MHILVNSQLGLTLLQLLFSRSLIPKQIRGDLPNLHLLTALGNAIPPKMPPDVLEGIMPRISHATMHLDRAVRGLRAQAVGVVIAHADLVAQLLLDRHPRRVARLLRRGGDLVHLDRRAQDQQAQHLRLRGQLDQRPLDGLVRAERLAEDLPAVGVLDAAVDAVLGGAAAGARLADAVLVREGLRDGEAVVQRAQHRRRRHAHVAEQHRRVVGRHVQRPLVRRDLDAGGLARHDERRDPLGRAGLARRACEHQAVRRAVHPRLPLLVAVDLVAGLAAGQRDRRGGRVHVRRVRAVVDLGQAEGRAEFALDARRDELPLLLRRAVVLQHDDDRVVADHAVLVLQVVGQAHAAAVHRVRRQVVADRAHVEVLLVAARAAVLGGEGEAVEPCFIRQLAGFAQQDLPFVRGQPLIVPLCAGRFSSVVEELVVVVLVLEWDDLVVDECVEALEVRLQIGWEFEVHAAGELREEARVSGQDNVKCFDPVS